MGMESTRMRNASHRKLWEALRLMRIKRRPRHWPRCGIEEMHENVRICERNGRTPWADRLGAGPTVWHHTNTSNVYKSHQYLLPQGAGHGVALVRRFPGRLPRARRKNGLLAHPGYAWGTPYRLTRTRQACGYHRTPAEPGSGRRLAAARRRPALRRCRRRELPLDATRRPGPTVVRDRRRSRRQGLAGPEQARRRRRPADGHGHRGDPPP